MSLGFYSDPGLTVPLPRLFVQQAVDGGAAAVDFEIYIGDPTAANAKVFRNSTDPGIASLMLSIASAGGGVPANSLRLSIDYNGLSTATSGAALDLGPEIYSGWDAGYQVFVRADVAAIARGTYDNLSLTIENILEVML